MLNNIYLNICYHLIFIYNNLCYINYHVSHINNYFKQDNNLIIINMFIIYFQTY